MDIIQTADIGTLIVVAALLAMVLVFVAALLMLMNKVYRIGHRAGYEAGVRRSEYEYTVAGVSQLDEPKERIRGEPKGDPLDELHASSSSPVVFQTLDEEKT